MDKFLSFLGLARKAGRAAIGTEAVRNSVRAKKAKLVILSTDCAKSAAKRAHDMCTHYNTELILTNYTMEQLGSAAGKAPSAMVSIDDDGLAAAAKAAITDKGAT